MALSTNRLMLTGLLAASFLMAHAQTPGIDPALLGKANGGDAAAQVKVGECYENGQGVARDGKQAAEWYRRAAEQRSVSGALHLAEIYRDGDGKDFPRDMEQAAGWYRKAADQGDAGAQGTLGMLYTLGQGVPRSDVEAYFWLDLAAGVTSPNQAQYIANRQNVGTRITAEELADVQDREEKWKAAHPRADSAH